MKLFSRYSVIFLIIFVAFVTRFYKLGEVPTGLYQDETAIGYNAYSIIETGKDEYGKNFPLYFKSFGDQKLPVYIYADAVSIKLFGLTPFAVRLPSAFFGFLTVIILYFFVRDLTNNKNLATLSTLFLALNPWSLHYNRATFEVSMSLFLFILGGLLLNKFFRNKTNGAFFAGTLCFIAGMYSYNLTRLLAPLLFALVIFANKKNLKDNPKREIILTLVIGAILFVPFFMTLLKSGGASSAAGTLIFSSAVVQAPLLEMRSYMIGLPFGTAALFFNKYLLTIWQYLLNISSYLSVEFFFIKGSVHGNHGIGNVGLFYLFELPLIIYGFVHMIRKKIPGTYLLTSWGILTVLVAGLTREAPHATRSFFLLLPLTVFSAAGAMYAYKVISNLRNRRIKYALLGISMLLVSYNLIYYFTSYYVRFPLIYAKSWRMHDKELSLYLSENDKNYEKIIIDKDADFIYTSLLFYSKYPPGEFQKSVHRLADDSEGFSKVVSFGKYEFREINWDKDIKRPKTLLITNPGEKPKNMPAIREIYFPERPVVLAADQRMYQLPVKEKAYVLVETK